MMTLRGHATEDPLSDEIRTDVVQALWREHTTLTLSEKEIQGWNTYFQYYTAECREAIEFERGDYTTVRRHEDIVAIADHFKNNDHKGKIRQALLTLDTQKRANDVKAQMAEGSIRLVVRLFAMVDIGPISGSRTQGPTPLPWTDDSTDLRTLLAEHFAPSSPDPGKAKFDEKFTAVNLHRLAGLDIKWTDNLANHLRLIDNDKTLLVFRHATFLRYQKRLVNQDLQSERIADCV